MAELKVTYGRDGIGRWDEKTTRYIPFSGGSRTKISVNHKEKITAYSGFSTDRKINSVQELFSTLGGSGGGISYLERSGLVGRHSSEQEAEKPEPEDEVAPNVVPRQAASTPFGTSGQLAAEQPVQAQPTPPQPVQTAVQPSKPAHTESFQFGSDGLLEEL